MKTKSQSILPTSWPQCTACISYMWPESMSDAAGDSHKSQRLNQNLPPWPNCWKHQCSSHSKKQAEINPKYSQDEGPFRVSSGWRHLQERSSRLAGEVALRWNTWLPRQTVRPTFCHLRSWTSDTAYNQSLSIITIIKYRDHLQQVSGKSLAHVLAVLLKDLLDISSFCWEIVIGFNLLFSCVQLFSI